MIRTRRSFSVLRHSRVILLLLSLVAALHVQAQNDQAQNDEEFECSNDLLEGRYGFSLRGFSLFAGMMPGGMFPSTSVGVIEADGMGNVTEWREMFTRSNDPRGRGAMTMERDVVADSLSGISFTLGANCRGAFTWTVRTPRGETAHNMPFVLVNRGREGFFSQASPNGSVILGSFKRMDDFDEQLQGEVDALKEELAEIKTLVRRLALVNGVLRRGE